MEREFKEQKKRVKNEINSICFSDETNKIETKNKESQKIAHNKAPTNVKNIIYMTLNVIGGLASLIELIAKLKDIF